MPRRRRSPSARTIWFDLLASLPLVVGILLGAALLARLKSGPTAEPDAFRYIRGQRGVEPQVVASRGLPYWLTGETDAHTTLNVMSMVATWGTQTLRGLEPETSQFSATSRSSIV